ENCSWRSAVSAYTSGSPCLRTTTLPSRAIQPWGWSTVCALGQPTEGSTQCQDDAATSASKRRPPSAQFSNDDVSIRTGEKVASRSLAIAAIAVPGSTAVTEHPISASARVACPVPQPTSRTDDP